MGVQRAFPAPACIDSGYREPLDHPLDVYAPWSGYGGRRLLRDIPVIVVKANERTTSEKRRLGGQMQLLLERDEFANEDLLLGVLGVLEEGEA